VANQDGHAYGASRLGARAEIDWSDSGISKMSILFSGFSGFSPVFFPVFEFQKTTFRTVIFNFFLCKQGYDFGFLSVLQFFSVLGGFSWLFVPKNHQKEI
jgi:hypothetical protein